MTITRGRLINPTTLPSTVGSVYTNPASTKAFIR